MSAGANPSRRFPPLDPGIWRSLPLYGESCSQAILTGNYLQRNAKEESDWISMVPYVFSTCRCILSAIDISLRAAYSNWSIHGMEP